MRQRAFTLIELLVVVGIVVVLVAITIPVLSKALESSRRAKCGANLNALGIAIRTYNEDHGEFPRAMWRSFNMPAYTPSYFADHQVVATAFGVARGRDPFSGSAPTTVTTNTVLGSTGGRPYDNDVTAALFLLIRLNHMTSKQFICPSAASVVPDTYEIGTANNSPPQRRSNFSEKRNLSYSVTTPYPSRAWDESGVPSAMDAGYTWGPRMRPNMAIAADINPGATALTTLTLNSSPTDMKQGNSNNHARAGQNVLNVAGAVEWATTPFAGGDNDNIYTRAAMLNGTKLKPTDDRASDAAYPFGGNPPTNPLDSVMLPAETARTQTGANSLMPY